MTRLGMTLGIWALVGASLALAACASRHYRPSQETRTASAGSYQVVVRKSGHMDINLMSGAPVFRNARPMVWIEGERAPRVLRIDGRLGTRTPVNTPLGQGHALLYKEKDLELLVQTYPTQPFVTVQAAFTNAGKQPVRVKSFSPWSAGEADPGGVSLGAGAECTVILENGRVFSEGDDFPRRVTDGRALSQWNLAAHNPASGRSLVAGFLTHLHGYTQVRLERTEAAPPDGFDRFAAECIYDPPVTVAPGGILKSELLYLGVAEPDPLAGLERFGNAMAAVNEVRSARPLAPHGWDSWNTRHRTDIDEASMLAALDFVDRHLKRYGWTHFAIDDGWQRMRGDWEADPARFPRGMKWLADEVHRRGMTAGIWVDAFRVDVNAPVAMAHPEWLRLPNAQGRGMVSDDQRILDITAPGAYEYVRDVFARIGREWGYDALMEADFVYLLLLADSYHNAEMTRVEVLRMGMQAIREGFGRDKFVMTMPPAPITGVFADGMRIGNDCAPIWRKQPDRWPWGAVETLTNAARRYYFAPHLWMPDQDCAYFGHPATRERWGVADAPLLTAGQSIAWLTGAALTGGVVKIGDHWTDLTPDQVAVLRRLLPVMREPARPVDLFESEHPRVWSLPLRGDAGEWHVLALFNWDETAPQGVTVPLARLGLRPGAYYTVYNFWADVYHGTAADVVEVNVPPGSVQLLGLRAFEDRPMLIASTRHFTQGALDLTDLRWDPAARTLSGTLDAIADTGHGLRFLLPAAYTLREVEVSVDGTPRTETVGRLLKVDFHARNAGPVHWRLRF